MRFSRQFLSLVVLATILHGSLPWIEACGPSYIEPVFMFAGSPDIPFEEFTSGNIGIIRPTFGRKALFIAYRYANGGSFSAHDQGALIEALRGKPPEDDNGHEAVKAWIEARKLVAGDEKLPDIYTDRNFGGYNFFPNCTKNAFEVAITTLNDRAGTHGSDDRNVREWLKGQDHVFEICSSGTAFPPDAGADAPEWLIKDRQYQIAAAHFYALNFDEARRRFDEIARDNGSVWQETADYLVGRTLVRHASLTKDAEKKRELYEQAELHLESVARRSGRFGTAGRQLIGLIRYRNRPKERVRELAQTLMYAGNDNLRQDIIDYTWLLDKFEADVIEQIEKRKQEEAKKSRAAAAEKNGIPSNDRSEGVLPDRSQVSPWQMRRDAVEKGEMISITLSYAVPGKEYPEYVGLDFKPDATDDEIVRAFELKLDRKLKEDEIGVVRKSKSDALAERTRFIGANFRFDKGQTAGYEGNRYSSEELTVDLIPPFLRVDDLSDWIFTFQIDDELAYSHSLKRWRESGSPAWLMAALAKAKKDSPDIDRLMRDGAKIGRTAPAFSTVAYHVSRLMIDLGRENEARTLLDRLLASDFRTLPVSTQNRFLELRMRVSVNLDEFLKFAGRRPVTFSLDGQYGRLHDFLENEKSYWNAENYTQSRDEYVRETEEGYRDLLPWDDQVMFDEYTIDILNRHFPLDVLAQAALHPELPEHLRRRMVLTVWTRAAVLGRRILASKFAAEASKHEPEMATSFGKYLGARTEIARLAEELWILIKNPKLTAFVQGGFPKRGENEVSSWEDGWWYEPSDTEYDRRYNEIPKVILRPSFVTVAQSGATMKERRQIVAAGDAETYLTNRILEWAKRAPRDPRIPEALYIAATINLQTKYGGGNQELRDKAIGLLKGKYGNSPWTAKALEEGQY